MANQIKPAFSVEPIKWFAEKFDSQTSVILTILFIITLKRCFGKMGKIYYNDDICQEKLSPKKSWLNYPPM